jgi:hypothetical protein
MQFLKDSNPGNQHEMILNQTDQHIILIKLSFDYRLIDQRYISNRFFFLTICLIFYHGFTGRYLKS